LEIQEPPRDHIETKVLIGLSTLRKLRRIELQVCWFQVLL